jgi:D-alanyl-D-alanine dipeptidase
LKFLPVRTIEQLENSVEINPEMDMVNLQKTIPDLIIDLRYASKNNFTGVRMYPANTDQTFLRKSPALAMVAAAKELKTMNLGFKIWDAYRPYHVTEKFWELIHDERYVANPAKGSGHNRGIAVDLTLYDLTTGKEINMPTGFDDFSEAAHHGQALGDTEKIKNRELLRTIMEKHGFIKFETEWWHYYWPGSDRFDVLDIPFEKLKKRKHAAKG